MKVFLDHFPPCSLKQKISLNPELTDTANKLAILLQGSPVSATEALRLQAGYHVCPLLIGVLWIQSVILILLFKDSSSLSFQSYWSAIPSACFSSNFIPRDLQQTTQGHIYCFQCFLLIVSPITLDSHFKMLRVQHRYPGHCPSGMGSTVAAPLCITPFHNIEVKLALSPHCISLRIWRTVAEEKTCSPRPGLPSLGGGQFRVLKEELLYFVLLLG